MPLESYTNNQLLLDLSTILKDLQHGIKDLHHIKKLVIDETEIISYEEKYCNQCKEPCGRSNAEIFNCMMKKMTENKNDNQVNIQQYTKEYLEHDLQKNYN